MISETNDISNGDEDFVVVRLEFARWFERENYGWVTVMVPRHAVEDLECDTPLGKSLGEALIDRELVEWDEEDDPDFCHSPRFSEVAEDRGDAPICRCWIDDEGNWRVSKDVVTGEDGDGEEVADEQA